MGDSAWCSVCGRSGPVVAGLGLMVRCSHSPDPDRPKRLAPAVASETEAAVIIERRRDAQALRRALVKSHTEEGRAHLSAREARLLADREP